MSGFSATFVCLASLNNRQQPPADRDPFKMNNVINTTCYVVFICTSSAKHYLAHVLSGAGQNAFVRIRLDSRPDQTRQEGRFCASLEASAASQARHRALAGAPHQFEVMFVAFNVACRI